MSEFVLYVVGLLHCACRPDGPELLDEATCGQGGPVRILEASEAERPRMIGQVGDRVIVRNAFDVVYTVGACGASPVTLEVAAEDALHVDEPGQRIWVGSASTERVGYWPADGGGAPSWVAEGVVPVGLVPGQGFVVVDRSTTVASLIAADGSSWMIADDVLIDEDTSLDFLRLAFQVQGALFAFADDAPSVRVVDLAAGGVVQRIEDARSIALSESGEWFVTGTNDKQATLHLRTSAEAIDLGRVIAVTPGIVNGPYVAITGPSSDGVYDVVTRTFHPAPDVFSDLRFFDREWRMYSTSGGTLWRWTPSTGELVMVAEAIPGMLGQVNDRAALFGSRFVSPFTDPPSFSPAWVVPLDGQPPWTTPQEPGDRLLVPDGSLLYEPTGERGEDDDGGPIMWMKADAEPVLVERRAKLPLDDTFVGGDVIFTVVDGERSGLYRAALPRE